MKKAFLTFALALVFGFFAAPAAACDGDCECPHGKDKAAHNKTAKVEKTEKVAWEGTVVSFGCPMKAEKAQCTGAALVVGESKHLIKKAGKGRDLVAKAKDTSKVVKVSGTKRGEFLTVNAYAIKG